MFIILAQQRSGTHLLGSLLNSHSELYCAGEILYGKLNNKYNFLRYLSEQYKCDHKTLQLSGHELHTKWNNYFSGIFQEIKERKPYLKQIGVIIMYNQIKSISPLLLEMVLSENSIIHLIRRNILRTYASDCINHATKQAHRRDPAEFREFHLDTDKLISKIESRKQLISNATKLTTSRRYIDVFYENLKNDRSNEITKTLEFIGADNESLRTELHPTNPWPLSSMLTNFKEVEEILRGTEYENFLYTD